MHLSVPLGRLAVSLGVNMHSRAELGFFCCTGGKAHQRQNPHVVSLLAKFLCILVF